jgi:hypothetical protein
LIFPPAERNLAGKMPSASQFAVFAGLFRASLKYPKVDSLVRSFDFFGASKESGIAVSKGQPPDNNGQVRGAWQRLLFEDAAIEFEPWTGPDSFPATSSRFTA